MRMPLLIGAALALATPAVSSPPVRIALPPQLVGPPNLPSGACPIRIETPNGGGEGRAIPVPALRLGAPVDRNAVPFPTGGGGTANLRLREERRQAGIQYEPRVFDTRGRARPSVFAVEDAQVATPLVYQHFPVRPAGIHGDNGMIFAQATSRSAGRIVSLALTLDTGPSARPRLIVTGGQPGLPACQGGNPVQVYAPAMTAAQARRLFSPTGCSWGNRAACTARQRPRGRVLFVQKRQGGSGYEHRWVDYDLVAGMSPGAGRGGY